MKLKLKLSKKTNRNRNISLYRILMVAIFFLGINKIKSQTDGFTNTFEYGNGTTYNQSRCQSDVGNCNYWLNSQNSDIQDKNLRIKFAQGVYGTNCGIVARSNINGNNVYTLEYKVKFDNGFDWRLGGKLPGLAGGSAPTGGGIPSDGSGFSTRYMWRENGRMVVYAYYKDQTDFYGENWNVGLNFQTGIWYTLKQTVTVNTGNNANGRVEVWVNGQKKLDRSGLRLMSQGNTVNRVLFDTFMGGNDPSWAPDHTQYLRMDNFKCVKGRDDGPPPASTEGTIEIENKYTVRNEAGTIATIGPDTYNPDASGGKFVRLYDTNDELSTTITISETGKYKLDLRLRTGEQSGTTTNLIDKYEIKVKGLVKQFNLIPGSISALDKDAYWGELTYTTRELPPGTHTIIVRAKSNWLKVDRLKFKKTADIQDKVVSMTTPTSVSPGFTATVKVAYSASTNRDLFVNFQQESNYASFASVRVPVTRGTGTIDIPVEIPANLPLGNDRYRFTTHIGPTGTFWNDRLDFKYKPNIDVVNNATSDCTIVVRAAGATGEEVIRLLINNQLVREWAVNSTSMQNYTTDTTSGGNVKVQFINDGVSSNGGDKNVRIDKITFAGTTVQSENAVRTGAGAGEWLWANGNFDYGTLNCTSNRSRNSENLTKDTPIAEVSVYPNPVNQGVINIQGLKNTYRVKLYNLKGQEVFSRERLSDSSQINLEKVAQGIYIMNIIDATSSETIQTSKLIVQ
ncbi:polysaccharide lyase [uncultured Aquimarina sp.]|uniref:polysaccharide lyase n=1 Tax=uncultured Aquimarina sp. TaxID=575652 RepID=UPI002638A7BE|nr:carbohydrate-binding domain-containing protein [uncultured Aquimarina sp.]